MPVESFYEIILWNHSIRMAADTFGYRTVFWEQNWYVCLGNSLANHRKGLALEILQSSLHKKFASENLLISRQLIAGLADAGLEFFQNQPVLQKLKFRWVFGEGSFNKK